MLDRNRVSEMFRRAFGAAASRVFSAPGRVNLIGEHTDYNDGFVLPFAIQHRTYIAACPRADRTLRVYAADLDQWRVADLSHEGARSRSWFDYVEGTARSLEALGTRVGGADVLVTSDIPRGAGLSSSAALEIATGFALARLVDRSEPDRLQIALAGQRAEHEWVGTKCGLMDQYIAAFAKPDNAILLDCRTLQGSHVPLALGTAAIVVLDSQVKHDLATSAYNERRAQCEQGVRQIASEHPNVRALRDVSPELLAQYERRFDPTLYRRCRHVVGENVRTLRAVDAFEQGNLKVAGALMLESHASLRDDYEVSCAALDFLVDEMRDRQGVYGARMTGGGFGGCVIALVASEAVGPLVRRVSAEYQERFGVAPQGFVTRASEGARED
jgi:galactokinase